MKIYFESFTCHEDVVREFALSDKELEGAEILYAIYDTDHYAGRAHVIFRQDGNVYEVNGSHCSCYGLEGQWSPEETTIQALLARPNVAVEAKEILQSVAIKNEGGNVDEIKTGCYVRVELGARSFTGIVRSVGGDVVTIWNDATGRARIARRSRVEVLSFPPKPASEDRPSRLTGWDLLVLGAGTTLIEELRKASPDPDNWRLADEHMPLTARRVMDRDDRWCVLVDASRVSEKDLVFDPAVLGFVYLSANKMWGFAASRPGVPRPSK